MKKMFLVFLAIVLMMYFYPLSILPLLILAQEWGEFREEWMKSALFIGASIPLYGAKIFLGISGWAKILGISTLSVSPFIRWAVYLLFTTLQTLAIYYIYCVSKSIGKYGRTGGLAMLIAVPLHLLSLKLYFILTWIGLILFLLSLKKKNEVME
ncbi:hypothetical protein [Thermococcus barophilus]|uniref:Transposase n=1 Tax=Thermococcus barophilus TaxID=55802 RepID=A0A0S1XCA5_THEBA|nr:hypothetical protein [Thermococcus barophilus]ALM75429.1 Transposase [Thermococcus barophilus]